MIFNSIDFLIFLPIVFFLYWFVFQKNLKLQNLFILVISYLFYSWWNWKFLSLIVLCSGINYSAGVALASNENQKKRKFILAISCIASLCLLGVFKYFNFFIDNFINAFALAGIDLHARTINIMLPIGISFYTFKALSYTIDVYKMKLEPTNDIIAFFSFVAFFPQLFAGPIDQANSLLPQFYTKRTFEYNKAVDGMRQILWGYFKKIVIADNCAIYVNQIFANYETLPASTLVLGGVYFSFQIYGDFSGYSDIAIGTSRLFGFASIRNFSTPYFRGILLNFGGDGIYRLLRGLKIIYIFLWVVIEEQNIKLLGILLLFFYYAVSGMEQAGLLLLGDASTLFISCLYSYWGRTEITQIQWHETKYFQV